MTLPLLSLASGCCPSFAHTSRCGSSGSELARRRHLGRSGKLDRSHRPEVRSRIADGGVSVLDVEVDWLKTGTYDPDHFRIIDARAAIGARNVLVVSSDPDPGATAAKLARLSNHAAPCGLQVSLEFAAFTEVRILAAALVILDSPSCETVGLLIDPLHLARTGGLPGDPRTVAASRFHCAQFCDAAANGPSAQDVPSIIEEALDHRLLVCAGDLPMAVLYDALPANLPLSIELRSNALREGYPDPAERARALLQSTRAGLATLR